jgi:hypothetical protein
MPNLTIRSMAAPLEDVATWEAPAAAQASAPAVVPPEPAAPAHSLPVSAIGERCPSCRARLAADQRYCLECGQRRGEPRLPFMDAVSFMDATARRRRGEATAPVAPPPRRRMSPNSTLIAGVGTLVVAMGVGVLIGHSSNRGEAASSGKPTVQVVKLGAGEAGSATAATASGGAVKAGKPGKGGAGAAKPSVVGSGKGAASVLHPKAKLAPPTVKVGGSCHSGAGCKHGKFTGEFFGE